MGRNKGKSNAKRPNQEAAPPSKRDGSPHKSRDGSFKKHPGSINKSVRSEEAAPSSCKSRDACFERAPSRKPPVFTNKSRRKPEETLDEFDLYENQYKYNKTIENKRIIEKQQDLFELSKEYSLAHCVAEDMLMGSGIAVQFRRTFRRVDELLNQRQKSGGLAVLTDNERFIYYLVTKAHSTGKPTYQTLFASLLKLRQHVEENHVKFLAMPTIGCGLDRLDWLYVKRMLECVFRDNEDVEIIVCSLEQGDLASPQRWRNCDVVDVDYPIQNIEDYTTIIYLTSEDGCVSEEMELLDEKFNFLPEFRHFANKRRGNVIFFTKKANYLLCGCVCKKTNKDMIDFKALQTCLMAVRKENDLKKFEFVGFQALKDNEDSCLNYKIINLLRNTFRFVKIYICWPGDLQELKFNNSRSWLGSNQNASVNDNGSSWRAELSQTDNNEMSWNDQIDLELSQKVNHEFELYNSNGDFVDLCRVQDLDLDVTKLPLDVARGFFVCQNLQFQQGAIAVNDSGSDDVIVKKRPRLEYYTIVKLADLTEWELAVFESLQKLREQLHKDGVAKITVPRLSDSGKNSKLLSMLSYIFSNSQVILCDYNYRDGRNQVVFDDFSFSCKRNIVCYFLTVSMTSISETMKCLNRNFSIKNDLDSVVSRELGGVVCTKTPISNVYGCVVRINEMSDFDDDAVEKCVNFIGGDAGRLPKWTDVYVEIDGKEFGKCSKFKIAALFKHVLENVIIHIPPDS